jgi:N-acetylated-alpha-linked acidic dipeptidase
VPIPPLPTLSAASEIAAMPKGKQGFARTQLARGQNRMVAALRQATRMVEGVL